MEVLRTSKGELTINLEVWKLSIWETGKFSNIENTIFFLERIHFLWNRACYEHQKTKTCWNGPKLGTWVHDGMKNDISPGFCIYNPSSIFASTVNTSLTKSCISLNVVTQHTTACCSMQVIDITLVKYHFTNITSLRVVQQKHNGLYSSTKYYKP
jgi:hypothetical protein